MVRQQPSKLLMRVRFSLPSPYSRIAQLAEQMAVNHRVVGSNPTPGAIRARGLMDKSIGLYPIHHAGSNPAALASYQ